MRGSLAEVILPKAPLVCDCCGSPKLVWLRTLKNSARNSACTASWMGNARMTLTSQLVKRGPTKLPLTTLPYVRARLVAKPGFCEKFAGFRYDLHAVVAPAQALPPYGFWPFHTARSRLR